MAVPEYPLFEECTSLCLKELSEQPLILSHRYRKYMLSAFERAGLVCDIYCACEDARTAMTLAEKGLGIAILPASMLEFLRPAYCFPGLRCRSCDGDSTRMAKGTAAGGDCEFFEYVGGGSGIGSF